MKKEELRTIMNTEPEYTGIAGKAWVLDREEFLKKHPGDAVATIKSWIVNCPTAHPVWSNYLIAVISLAEFPGVAPAEIRMPNATHEIMVIALNPDIIPTLNDEVHFLTPINFSGQFIIKNDEGAVDRLDQVVHLVCDGKLNPDTDARGQWERLFPQE
jgi:hypothetical protein